MSLKRNTLRHHIRNKVHITFVVMHSGASRTSERRLRWIRVVRKAEEHLRYTKSVINGFRLSAKLKSVCDTLKKAERLKNTFQQAEQHCYGVHATETADLWTSLAMLVLLRPLGASVGLHAVLSLKLSSASFTSFSVPQT